MERYFRDIDPPILLPFPEPKRAIDIVNLYRDESRTQRIITARYGLWAAIFVYILFSITDFILIPDVAWAETVTRFAVGIVIFGFLEIQISLKANHKFIDITCAFSLIAGYAAWLHFATQSHQLENLRYYMVFGTIFMMGANLFFGLDLLLSIATSSAVLILFFWTIFHQDIGNTAYNIAFGAFYISCFVFTSYINFRLNRERHHVFLNATEARKQHREAVERGKALLRLSNTDYLTGLENRRAIDQRLRDFWGEWQNSGKDFATLLVDVDFFKNYNDFYGHQAGDHCLVLVANALKEAMLPFGGLIGRYGGEEFIALVQTENADKVEEIGETLRRTVQSLAISHEPRKDGLHVVTVSVGASFTHLQCCEKMERLVTDADRALYSAKANGRNCVRIYDPADPHTGDSNEHIAALLRTAVQKGLVSVVYQPIINLKTGHVDAVETLMRMNLLDGSPVPPSVFIPIAERTGSIHDLGLWTIRQACKDILAPRLSPIVSVNVSPMQLKTKGFAQTVAAILEEYDVKGHQLALEITEGIDMAGQSDIILCLKDLGAMGINIWLDDFGTGFAGLSWLRLFNFGTVKIDRSFLQDCDSQQGRIMLKDIVSLIRNRGHKILVEGIETQDQLLLLQTMRIDQGQGYHLGRPVALPVLQDLLRADKSADIAFLPQDTTPKIVRKAATD
ncbi:EAL domain-containing protein [Allorhizobium sp. BGMRC 0089]|uniref:putative bifunctional diguanylate cyclase/phosphodiesterase n=1 Tax=Allorhizobium sonneratiae TaxID=2934936 RepID=UPI002033421A|nr:GGDEF domain-containing phosphodiesterase [Allorhizobium sonneratiae]MCM2292105.1 EAL domain-containing protein [Allorhizobium sonneratiae]